MDKTISLLIIIYLIIGAIYVVTNWKMVENDTKSKREPSFIEGFIHGLSIAGAMICFPYYIFRNKKK